MYTVVNQNNFKVEVLDNPNQVIVDFWAPWCGPCQMLGPIIDEIGDELKDTVKVTKLNVDENQELASNYNVSSIPAVLIFEKGKLKNTIIGFHQKQDYLNALK
ncbi:MAG: thioredoxin [Candidatus Shapirobacteria bacterium]